MAVTLNIVTASAETFPSATMTTNTPPPSEPTSQARTTLHRSVETSPDAHVNRYSLRHQYIRLPALFLVNVTFSTDTATPSRYSLEVKHDQIPPPEPAAALLSLAITPNNATVTCRAGPTTLLCIPPPFPDAQTQPVVTTHDSRYHNGGSGAH